MSPAATAAPHDLFHRNTSNPREATQPHAVSLTRTWVPSGIQARHFTREPSKPHANPLIRPRATPPPPPAAG